MTIGYQCCFDFLLQLFNSCIINVKLNFWFCQSSENFFWKFARNVLSGITEGSLHTFESIFLTWLQFKTNLIVSFLSLHKATNCVSLWPSDVRSLLSQFPSQLRFKSTSCMALVLLPYSCEILKNCGSISFCNKQLTWSSEYKMFNLISKLNLGAGSAGIEHLRLNTNV